jgi:hypothetical protein
LAPSSSHFLALVGVAQDLVGFGDPLEARFRGLVAGIDVRVMLARQLAVRLLDVLLAGGFRHAERRVVVLEVHR